MEFMTEYESLSHAQNISYASAVDWNEGRRGKRVTLIQATSNDKNNNVFEVYNKYKY